MTDRVKLAGVSLVIAIVLWCVTNADAMGPQTKIIIEDNSGPWLLLASVISAVASMFAARLALRAWRK